MRLPIRKLVVVAVVAAVFLIVAYLTRPEFGMEETARAQLAALPGKLEISFLNADDRTYTITGGVWAEIDQAERSEYPPPVLFPLKAGAPGFVTPDSFAYRVPFLHSPDKSLLVSAISDAGEPPYVRDNFIIIDLTERNVIYRRQATNERYIVEFIWSPDSQWLAVLEAEARPCFALGCIVSSLSGHPISIYTYFLSVHDRVGQLLVQTKVASGVEGGGTGIAWLPQ